MIERKKKVRINQTQSSRLYLRRKDHRDMIMNDIYHNAMLKMNEQNKMQTIWHKYKHHLLLGNIYGYFTSIDFTNQIVHTATSSATTAYRIIQLKDYMVASLSEDSAYADREILISKNGCDWYAFYLSNKKTYPFVPYGDTNSFAYTLTNGNVLNLYQIEIVEDSATKELSLKENGVIASHLFSESIWNNIVLSQTDNGILVAAGGYYGFSFWEANDSGFTSLLDITNNGNKYFNQYNKYAFYGNHQAVFPYVMDSETEFTSKIKAKVIVFNNGTGTVYDVDEINCPSDARTNQYYDVIYRNHKWWFYWYQAIYEIDSSYHKVWHYRLKIYQSTDCIEWQEISVPDYCDVNLVETTFKSGIERDFIRIQFNSDAILPGDGATVVSPYFYVKNFNAAQIGLEFYSSLNDGKWLDTDQFICFRLTNGYYAVFDNMTWSPNDDCFAFGTNSWKGYQEPLMRGDYCYK